jgi:hypothetical protein
MEYRCFLCCLLSLWFLLGLAIFSCCDCNHTVVERRTTEVKETSFICWCLYSFVDFLLLMLVLLLDFDLLTSSNQLERQIRISQIWTQSNSISLTIYFLLHLWPSLHNTTHTSKDPNQSCVQTTNISTTIVLTETILSKLIRGRQSKNLY